ncbi:MAG TPA: PSD1 and planctomycete cytochrome C domain-containing protein, partial [Bryobacteraceae bacterium]|nr:PSD1 and planctomycete cytochrome C domain-containing protein [Bryobacteraceae bacterium]
PQVSFPKDIAPVLAAKCVQCHGATSQMSDLDLRTPEGLAKGGKHGAVIAAGKSGESMLYLHLTGQQQPQMPFGSRLTDQQIALFKAWIDSGAQWDASATMTSAAVKPTFTPAQKRYWFYQPVAKPVVPKTSAKSPVDAFIVARLDEKKIRMNGKADKITLLRRATLDLTGLPPTPEETQAFLADESPEAFAKVVDRLLASPHYGERWGREWLDVARYADSNGFKADEFRPNIWRYRDYVIQAFNEDKPYDRFIREQIAGDELYPQDLNAKVATGFLRHYTDETNQPSMELRRSELLNNVTDTVASAFMGMTFGCAKCHDHKFDPILQKDYYRLQSFFANIRPVDETVLLQGEALAKYQQQQAEYDAKAQPIRAEMHAMVETFAKTERDYYMPRFSAGTQEAIKTPEAQRTPYQQLLAFHGMPQISHTDESFAKKLKPAEKKHFDELVAQLKSLDSLKPKPPVAQTIIDNGPEAPKTFVLAGGSWMAPKEEVQPGFLTILDPNDAAVKPLPVSTGRRSALANWLADSKNPLTARVMANRIWQGHFGTGIVASSSDFGMVGERPSNQPLLDYLAASFVENGWSVKKLHREIMLSNAYQASSLATDAAAAVDPDNKLLWHYPRHRVEGESLRDAMLLTSGKLNPKVGGPGMRPELPAGVNAAGYSAWPVEREEAEANRRSVYVVVKRILTYPMFEAFDAPSTEESCPRRFATVVPGQALAMMNDKLVLDWSRALAGRVLNDGGLEPAQQIERAYRLTLSRAPKPEETKTVAGFLEKQTAVLAGRLAKNEKVLLPDNIPAGMDPAKAAAFVDFCHTLMSSNEFMYIN